MKRKFIKRLLTALACVVLLFSLSLTAVSAEDAEADTPKAEESESLQTENEENGTLGTPNVFEAAFTALEGFSSEILCALSFIGSMIIAFAYRKGLLPTVKNGIGAIGNAIGSMKESTESYAKQGEELLALMTDRLDRAERTLEAFEKAVAEIAEKSEDGEHAAHDRAEMKALMSAQIDMLYDIFMTSSLPQYQKDAVSERVREMKEVTGE